MAREEEEVLEGRFVASWERGRRKQQRLVVGCCCCCTKRKEGGLPLPRLHLMAMVLIGTNGRKGSADGRDACRNRWNSRADEVYEDMMF